MTRRVRRPAAHAELLDRLTSEGGNPFQSYYEALTFCAALGYKTGRRESFEDHDEPIRWELFQNNIEGSDELVAMLTAASVGEVDALAEESSEEQMRIFEEYANGGLSELSAQISSKPAKTTREVVLDIVLAEEEGPPEQPDWESLAEGLAS